MSKFQIRKVPGFVRRNSSCGFTALHRVATVARAFVSNYEKVVKNRFIIHRSATYKIFIHPDLYNYRFNDLQQ
jgi:hypothetical protein